MTAYGKTCTAISILQQHILAKDSALLPEKMFGDHYMPSLAIEQAVALLIDVLPDIENVKAAEE
ncbi:MAG: hypothetical protein ACK5II_08445 [Paracoccus sp. (in: a-proteobacteria)]